MDILANFLHQVKVPTANDNIYSEECVFSFDTPVSLKILNFFLLFKKYFVLFFQECETGLYISLATFLGFGKSHVDRYYQKTNHSVFLHIQRLKTEVKFVSRLIKDDFAIKLFL